MDVKKFNTEDYAIILRPHLDEEQRWLGEVSVDIMTSEHNKLDDDDFWEMMHFTSMVCASIPVMDRNPQFKSACLKESELYLQKRLDYAKDKVIEKKDNVITINFSPNERER